VTPKKHAKLAPDFIEKVKKASTYFINPNTNEKVRIGVVHLGICRMLGLQMGCWRMRRIMTQAIRSRGIRVVKIKGRRYFSTFPVRWGKEVVKQQVKNQKSIFS
jgi:hypothetical protein